MKISHLKFGLSISKTQIKMIAGSLAILLQFQIALAKVEGVIGSVPLAQNPNIGMAIPTSDNSEIMISREQYLLSYNKNRRAPNWVSWRLEANQIGSSGRSNDFRQDTELETYLTQSGSGLHAVLPTDFKDSCFDRGHQIPSGDRTDTAADNSMTFVMSNMIPQTPYLNRVIWEHLEDYTRSLVQQQGKKVFVIDGPIYDQDFGSIGPNHDIPVPSKDFKIVFILDANQTIESVNSATPYIAVIMPNILEDGQNPIAGTTDCAGEADEEDEEDISPLANNNDDWKQYQTTLEDVQQRSGFSFTGIAKVSQPTRSVYVSTHPTVVLP